MKKKAIIIDIDGTFGHDPGASNYAWTNPKDVDWEAWNLSRVDLPVNAWCREIIATYDKMGYFIIYVTGRSADQKGYEVTSEWLAKNSPTKKYKLIMRPPGSFGRDAAMKRELYCEQIMPHYNVALAIDDKRDICEMWQDLKIDTLYCGDMSQLVSIEIVN